MRLKKFHPKATKSKTQIFTSANFTIYNKRKKLTFNLRINFKIFQDSDKKEISNSLKLSNKSKAMSWMISTKLTQRSMAWEKLSKNILISPKYSINFCKTNLILYTPKMLLILFLTSNMDTLIQSRQRSNHLLYIKSPKFISGTIKKRNRKKLLNILYKKLVTSHRNSNLKRLRLYNKKR